MLEGKVLELFTSHKGSDERLNHDCISLDEQGILDDKFYAKNVDRSVLITSLDSYKMAKDNNMPIPYGYLGENILVDINPYSLSEGNKIQMGEVILEITNNCTICNSLAKVNKELPKLLAKDRGIFAKTIKGGNIRKGNVVKILKYE